jgi:uncharacterized protein YndB with AHSA1/START domain
MKPDQTKQPDLTIVREFNAPRERVFAAFTDPGMMVRWWGPYGFTTPLCELDARSGGTIRIQMRGADGTTYPMLNGVYREFVPPERLVLHLTPGDQTFDTLQTVTLAERAGKTVLTLEVFVLKSTPEAAFALAGMEQGWNESLDRLGDSLAR